MMPSYPHPIRLRGPWQCEPVARTVRAADGSVVLVADNLPPSGVVRVPGEWSEALGPGFFGRVRFRRHFHGPTGLESHERLTLVIEGIYPAGDVELNGRHLGRVNGMDASETFDVTALVQPNNDLKIEVEWSGFDTERKIELHAKDRPPDGGRVGKVRLEIVTTR